MGQKGPDDRSFRTSRHTRATRDDSITPPDASVPRGNPELGDGGVVQVIDAEWKRRAGVARNLSAELAEALSKLRAAGQKNHYGTVPEGTEFSARAIEFISMLSSTVTDFQEELGVLANKCEIAHTELETIDDSNGREFQA
ncbi:hypothetical protein GOPIP_063_00390 [Gordonia polyisoprenivorans NBRC 16320 = JCM 10675]|uniref:Uncharacterized protein n=1 Tax=Gordonia polyisoprenivorans TaxID=84595 RepID=A0A846WHX2_9ACTN|nr:hypothetical protein [Gordonia polyisoprenivorans]NKY00490.1 hypothetical protein [Gordonia polyisoprenivorans]GAB24125.1 hypothetical protein GOPIP_063_00390 [Gordonia polyisoprenivorans NBRC 16320 = JCM 10675]